MRPQRRQPTRLPRPWESPGKNTGGVAISFSNAWKWKNKVKSLSHVQLLVTPWTAAHQAPPSMGFSRQEYWSGVPSPSPSVYLLIPNSQFIPPSSKFITLSRVEYVCNWRFIDRGWMLKNVSLMCCRNKVWRLLLETMGTHLKNLSWGMTGSLYFSKKSLGLKCGEWVNRGENIGRGYRLGVIRTLQARPEQKQWEWAWRRELGRGVGGRRNIRQTESTWPGDQYGEQQGKQDSDDSWVSSLHQWVERASRIKKLPVKQELGTGEAAKITRVPTEAHQKQ